MSLAYCFDCLERIDWCKCGNPSNEEIYGKMVDFERGYRQCLEDYNLIDNREKK